jgi:ubiquitin-protein ligase
LLYIEMEADYPMFPPKARFITPIHHPNINRHGRICHSILDRNWTADTTTKDVIDTIYSLLLVPEFSDPINTVVTLNYHWDEAQFKEEVQRSIQKHAKKTRAEWREEIAG